MIVRGRTGTLSKIERDAFVEMLDKVGHIGPESSLLINYSSYNNEMGYIAMANRRARTDFRVLRNALCESIKPGPSDRNSPVNRISELLIHLRAHV
jgi:hypothetical protein